jgi:tetratricopeptide (TPR) repeat protein
MRPFIKLRELVDRLNEEITVLKTKVEAKTEFGTDFDKRLDSLRDDIHDRFSVRDEILNAAKAMNESLAKQNDALHKTIGLRWNVITGLITFIGVLTVITFGYAGWKTIQIAGEKEELRTAVESFKEREKQVKVDLLKQSAELAKQSDDFARLSYSTSLLFQATRELAKQNYPDVHEYTARAIDILIGMISPNYDQTLGIADLDVVGLCQANEKTIKTSSESSQRQAIVETLTAAYDLKATAYFQADDHSNIMEVARSLLRLDRFNWQGYHWSGIALTGKQNFPEATSCFKKSVSLSRYAEKDRVNLIELLFVQGSYAEAESAAKVYLGDHKRPNPNSLQTLFERAAIFYSLISGYLVDHRDVKEVEDFITLEKKPENFERIFSPSLLNIYLSGKLREPQDGIKRKLICQAAKHFTTGSECNES